MKKVLKEFVIILGVYIIFTLYLFVVSERIERLEENNNYNSIKISK